MPIANTIRKISVKTLGIAPSVREFRRTGKIGETKYFGVIYGRAGSTRAGTTTQPDGKVSTWTSLIGQFEATVYDDAGNPGKIFNGAECFIPGNFERTVIGKMTTNEAGYVDFAFEVGALINDSNIGFEYVVRNLLAPKGVDPMSEIRDEMLRTLTGNQQAQLPAPETTATGDDKKLVKGDKKR